MSFSRIIRSMPKGDARAPVPSHASAPPPVPRSPHCAQAMHTLNSIPPEIRTTVQEQGVKIAKRVFAEKMESTHIDFKEVHTAKPKAKIPHNGNEIREAYHGALDDIEHKKSQGTFASLLAHEEKYGPVISALLLSTVREEVRMCAWKHMTAQEGVELLKARNLELHGRAEGPSFEMLIDKCGKKNPEITELQIWEEITGKTSKTSKEHDEKFGAVPVAIRVSPSGDVESAVERLARIAEESTQTILSSPR